MQSSKRARTAIFLTVFVDLLGFGIVIPILPLYAQAIADHPSHWMESVNHFLGLGGGSTTPGAFWAGVAFLSFSLMQFIASPILGRISDVSGRKPVLWMSLAGSAVGYMMLALTSRFEWILAARILDGITGGNISVAQAAMADTSDPSERSKVMGMIGAAFGLGFVLGPALAGVLSGSAFGHHLLETRGWHLPFFVAAGLSLAASLMVLLWLPETLTPEVRARARASESRGHALVKALKRPGMPQLLGVSLLAMAGFSMMEGTFALLVHQRFNFHQREVGYLFAGIGVLLVIYQGGLVRTISKRVPERAALITGLVLMGAALPLMPRADWMWPFLLLLIPLSWGSGMGNTAGSALASQLTPPEDQGSLFGVMNAMTGLGRIIGPAVGTFTFARWGGHSTYAVAGFTLVLALALALTLSRKETR
ncbi:tetracycline resistance MFS efflux pump [Geothrix oryzae]|uniref:Tetracycline resistance MFS efflux pump n=1 Tax=Geothrix oryzae TaxID=2927975 RepID=A0ABM8DPT0_9BACT|nr:MFS transporter [Geothrix oryzae]BDU69016.1 tetracycline resistance MFS efflux pump [Geothrix oryzae]